MSRRSIGFTRHSGYIPGRVGKCVSLIFICVILLSGCKLVNTTFISTPEILQSTNSFPEGSASSTIAPTNTSQPKPTTSPTRPPLQVWLPSYLPEKLRSSIQIPAGFNLATSPDNADITLMVSPQDQSPDVLWVYALVAPFPTILDGVTSDQLRGSWSGEDSSPFEPSPLLMDQSTLEILSAFWGNPAPGVVQVLHADQLLEFAWSNSPSWAILPFEMLDPRWKVLAVDGQSPIHKDFDPTAYPLSVPLVITGDLSHLQTSILIPATNRDPSKLTTVVMTGVTAMVRATAFTMEQRGITYPAQDIGPLLAQADITHISNEIPFSPDCPYPTPTMNALVFCSRPSYIDLLKAVGTDIVELTGDHFMDYGTDATLYTLQMYKDLGWPYYGGGANAEEARQPVKLENNGNRIAFLGCNIGCQVKTAIPCDAIATNEHPGAAQCDFDWISSEIPSLRDDGYQVIFTFQHREYYTYTTEPILANDFGLVASAGASIVSGSQAHQSHGFAFEDGAFIHYGLGNLFFDQYHYCAYNACDDAFIDRHVFYDGQYISTELITIHFVDFARPRFMSPEERAHFLQIIFTASGW